MSKTTMLIVLVIAVCLQCLLHFWLGRRLIGPWTTATAYGRTAWVLLLVAAPVSLAGIVLGRVYPKHLLIHVLQWIGFIVMGWVFLTAALVIMRDVLLGFWWLAQRLLHGSDPESAQVAVDAARRQALKNMTSLAIVAASSGMTAGGIRSARKTAEVKAQDIPIKGLDPRLDGFKILQLSDIHVGDTIGRAYLQRIVDQCKDLEVDLIAITGDLVDQSVANIADDVAPIFDLNAPHGVYFITGNHEYYVDARAWVQHLRSHGMDVLIDEHRVIEHRGAQIVLAGVADYSAPRVVPEHESNPQKAFQGAPTDALRILLAHQPKSVRQIQGLNVHVQLSGHTHGGQIWPFNYLVYLDQPYVAGLHQVFEQTQLYISRGTGYWGPPMRVAAPSEITLITLRAS